MKAANSSPNWDIFVFVIPGLVGYEHPQPLATATLTTETRRTKENTFNHWDPLPTPTGGALPHHPTQPPGQRRPPHATLQLLLLQRGSKPLLIRNKFHKNSGR